MNSEVPTRHTLDDYIAKENKKSGLQMNGLSYLVILVLIIGLFLFLFKPAFVTSVDPENNNRRLDWGKLIIWSLVISLGALILLWLTRGIHKLF